jgi:ribosome-associated translation inhibitor RaiA
MDIRIKTTDYSMPLEVADYLDQRIAAIEKLLSGDAKNARCEVEVGRAAGHPQQGDIWRAEFIVIREGERSVAVATGESVNAAIDLAKDEILQQLRKNKGKSQTLSKRMGSRFKEWTRWGNE